MEDQSASTSSNTNTSNNPVQPESNQNLKADLLDNGKKKLKFKTLIVLLLVVGLIFGISLYIYNIFSSRDAKTDNKINEESIQKDENAQAFISSKMLIDTSELSPVSPDVVPNISPYTLPLNESDMSNFKSFSEKVNMEQNALSFLKKNGFVVADTPPDIKESPEEFKDYYTQLTNKDIPVFITTDSLLHYYHVFFDTALMRLEKDIFYDDIWKMSKGFFDDQVSLYEKGTSEITKEAAKRNIAYLSVVLELLEPDKDQVVNQENVSEAVSCQDFGQGNCSGIYEDAINDGTFSLFGKKEAEKYSFETPSIVSDLVSNELALIESAEGWKCSPIYLYGEDYSQYIPRGHYTRSEKLKNYFMALMWYGRLTNLVEGSPNMKDSVCNLPPGFVGTDIEGFVSDKDAQIQTLSALLLANKYSGDTAIQNIWTRLYAITSFFVGFSDDLGPVEYSEILKKMDENNIDLYSSDIDKDIDFARDLIKNELPKPKIYGGLGNAQLTVLPPPPLTQEQIDELKKQAETLLGNTQGFRLMGQREVVDSTIFSEIVSPYSGEYTGDPNNLPFTWVLTPMKRQVRGFPRGLDIMAVFGSKRAEEIISLYGDADYSEYERVMSEQKDKINKLPKDQWYKNIYWSWLHVLRSLITDFGNGYPTFMTTTPWQDQKLNTALASWAELRHDTILYVKQSYTMAEMGGGPEEKPIVGYVEPIPEFYSRLSYLTKLTNTGLSKLLTEDEKEKISVTGALDSFDEILERLLEISKSELENKELKEEDYLFIKYFGNQLENINKGLIGSSGDDEVDPDMFKTTMVADVHTDGNTLKVLEEGVGYIKTLIVAYKVPDGRILVGAGPVFSYYEFKHPMDDRLTDEAWRSMLSSTPPDEPEWVSSFMVE